MAASETSNGTTLRHAFGNVFALFILLLIGVLAFSIRLFSVCFLILISFSAFCRSNCLNTFHVLCYYFSNSMLFLFGLPEIEGKWMKFKLRVSNIHIFFFLIAYVKIWSFYNLFWIIVYINKQIEWYNGVDWRFFLCYCCFPTIVSITTFFKKVCTFSQQPYGSWVFI